MQELPVAARERGIDRFRCEVLKSNDVVVGSLLDVGAVVVERGPDTVVLDVPLVDTNDSLVHRALRIVSEHINAFLRRLVPPILKEP